MQASLMRVHHPPHGQDPDLSPTARFGGYPGVLAPTGVVAADDVTNRFLSVLNGFPLHRWHRDVDWSLGVPAADRGVIYTGAGGPGAVRGLLALDAATGATRWVFAPNGLPRDPTRLVPTRIPRAVRFRTGEGELNGDPEAGRKLEALLRSVGANPKRLKTPIKDDFRQVMTTVDTVKQEALLPHGHWSNSGLVISNGRIYAEVASRIAAMDQATGKPIWEYPLPRNTVVRSIVATPEHLVACVSVTPGGRREPVWAVRSPGENALVALRLKDGKEEWVHPVEKPGNLALSQGLLFFTDGDLHVFAPEERTFDLAVDSPRKEDYRPKEEPAADPAAPAPDVSPCAPAEPARTAPEKPKGLAEATVVRLFWGERPEAMLQRIAQRRAVAPGARLLVLLDWLDASRAGLRGAAAGTLPTEQDLAATAQLLALQGRPDHLDIAPEINVFLARYPDRLPAVKSLLRAAAQAVRSSPSTRAVVSFNAETFVGSYGRGKQLPFGPLPKSKLGAAELAPLLEGVDELGIASFPQSGYGHFSHMPANYFTAIRDALGAQRVLVTSLAVRREETPHGDREQAGYLQRLLGYCYWLQTPVVAYPDLTGGKTNPAALVLEGGERPGLTVWHDTLNWKRVERLSVTPPETLRAAR